MRWSKYGEHNWSIKNFKIMMCNIAWCIIQVILAGNHWFIKHLSKVAYQKTNLHNVIFWLWLTNHRRSWTLATLLPKPHFFIQDIDDQPIVNFSSGQFTLIETFHEEANTLLIKKIAFDHLICNHFSRKM